MLVDMRPAHLLTVTAALLAINVAIALAQRPGAFDQSLNHPAIQYRTADTHTVVDALNQKLADKSAALAFAPQTGYLKSVLDLLGIPVESQVLVYSQTSLQARHIRMDNPRAIYFNDVASVAYIRGAGLLEIVAQDAAMGSIFYTVRQEPVATATFGRDQQCLSCHVSWDTLAVAGQTILSTFPRKTDADYANGFAVDHYRPIEDRWGGWYVTGKRVPARHVGNLPLFMAQRPVTPPPARVSLEGQVDMSGYLTPYSDVVSLMVLDHQAHLVNLFTRATWESRVGGPASESRVAEAVDAIVDYMLFVDEAPAEVSAQLHDLLAFVPGVAAAGEGSGGGEDQPRAGRGRDRQEVRASHAGGSPGDCRDSEDDATALASRCIRGGRCGRTRPPPSRRASAWRPRRARCGPASCRPASSRPTR